MEGEVKCLKLIPKRNRLFHNCKSCERFKDRVFML